MRTKHASRDQTCSSWSVVVLTAEDRADSRSISSVRRSMTSSLTSLWQQQHVTLTTSGWFGLSLFTGTLSKNRLYHAIGVGNISQWNNTIDQEIINTLRPGLCGDHPLGMVRLPQRSLSSHCHLASIDNLTRTTKRQNTYKWKLTIHESGPNKQQKQKLSYTYTVQKMLPSIKLCRTRSSQLFYTVYTLPIF